MPKITAIVHAYNEEPHIGRCLDSLKWADEILYVDTYSTDRTVEVARAYTDRILFHTCRNSAETKNWAISQARHEWLVFLGPDEVMSQELAREIRGRIGQEAFAGYRVNREMVFWERLLASTYWNPNYQVRVFRRGSGRFENREVHARVILDGAPGCMRHTIAYHSCPDLATCIAKVNRLTTLEAKQMLRDGTRFGPHHFPLRSLIRSLSAFWRQFFSRGGYRDGKAGLVLSTCSALYVFVADAKYRELTEARGPGSPARKRWSDGGCSPAARVGTAPATTIAAILHTYNEASQIARCLDSLRWVDEILLVDTLSTDRTVEIARTYTDRILQRPYVNAATTKNWALEHAPECEWLLFVDADEVVPPALAEEIRPAISNAACNGYEVNVLTHLGDKASRSTYWNPNYQTRLFRRGFGRWEDRMVHAHFQLQGSSRRLRNPILHFPYPDLETYLTKLNRYTGFEARQMLNESRPLRYLRFPFRSVVRSVLQFARLFVGHRGYLDGIGGLAIYALGAIYPFLADAKYWELAAETVRGPEPESHAAGN